MAIINQDQTKRSVVNFDLWLFHAVEKWLTFMLENLIAKLASRYVDIKNAALWGMALFTLQFSLSTTRTPLLKLEKQTETVPVCPISGVLNELFVVLTLIKLFLSKYFLFSQNPLFA